ncbi:hypothetical protein [Oceanithermus sp.]
MERFARAILFGLIAVFALSSCGNTPISVPLGDFSINIDATTNTLGYVVYPYNPTKFDKPVINVKSITITGKVKATYTSLTGDNLNMTFYARATSPENNPDCDGTSGVVWICKSDNEKPVTGSYTFTNGEEQSITFGSTNSDVLAEGINNGEIWIGAMVSSGAATNVQFDFTNMVANVTIF